MTDLQLGIIGCPLTHSLSPVLQSYLLEKNGRVGSYRKHEISPPDPANLKRFIRQNRLIGFNVTIPFKENIARYLDAVDDIAARVGAVNTVAIEKGRSTGYNTDIGGFLRAMQQSSVKIKEETAIILGAGGAARSVVHGLLQSGVGKILLANRTPERAAQFIEAIKQSYQRADILAVELQAESIDRKLGEARLIINCTPVGMWPALDQTPLEFLNLLQNIIVIDLIYNPLRTLFLKQAQKMGATIVDGLDMFIFQGVLSFEIWTRGNVKLDYPEIRNHLIEKMKIYEPN